MTGRGTDGRGRPAAPRARRGRPPTWPAVPLLTALALLVVGCSRANAPTPTPGPTQAPATVTSIVGTSTVTSTLTTVLGTLTRSGTATTVTATPTGPVTIGPPPTTSEPAPVRGTCPYLSNQDVMDANGQHTGATTVIDTEPYPVCIFTRSDGGYLATTRIVQADSPAQAAAAVNQHVPPGESDPATFPAGWTGGAMVTPGGLPGYPQAASIYAVSKGDVAIIAISNQKQSIKGRQMVELIVANLGL